MHLCRNLVDSSIDWAGVCSESLSAIAVMCMEENVASRYTAQAAAMALTAEEPSCYIATVPPASFLSDAASKSHIASSHRLDGTSAATVYFEWK